MVGKIPLFCSEICAWGQTNPAAKQYPSGVFEGTVIDVTTGAAITGAQFPCVTGTISISSPLPTLKVYSQFFDARGRPAAKAAIDLSTVRGLSQRLTASADEHGHFRVQAPPGSYQVCAKSQYEAERSWNVPKSPLRVITVSACYANGSRTPTQTS